MMKYLRPLLVLFILLTAITGLIYPMIITGVGKILFPNESRGSIIYKDGVAVGSSLIGQNFTESKYFWSRPSATSSMSNNASASSGSNLGPLNPALLDSINARIEALKSADPNNNKSVPVDLVTASASGLDPDISSAGAYYQASRVAKERSIPLDQINSLIEKHIEHKNFLFLGEERVNVLKLNLDLDKLRK